MKKVGQEDICAQKTHHATVFENHRKSLIQHCERSERRLHFEWTEVHQNGQFGEFLKT